MPNEIDVWRKTAVRLDPIRERLATLESKRQVTRICRDAGISRNQLYLIARGGSNTTEETLRKVLQALDLSWDDVCPAG